MTAASRIAITLPSSLSALDLAQMVAEQIAKTTGFDEDGQLDFGLAIREGAINAMKHGNGFEESVPVQIEFEMADTTIKASIVDRGDGFDPDDRPDPTSPENVWRTSGRGLLLIRSLVDELSFARLPDGMQITLTKTAAVAAG